MSTTTTNLNLVKPAGSEYVDVDVINSNYDIIDQFAGGVVDVEANPAAASTDNLAKLKVGSTVYAVPAGVSWTQTQQSGTKIATITIGSTPTDVYAPSASGGGSTVSFTQIQQTGTKIGTLNIDGVDYDIFTPNSLSSLSDVSINNIIAGQVLKYNGTAGKWENAADHSVSVTQITSSGTNIADITVDGTTTHLYAPTSGGATSLADLSDTTITTPSNGQILTYNSTSSKWENSNASGASWTDVTGTLTAGSTSITLSDASITISSTIEVFNDLDVPYNSKSLSAGSITLTFDAQQSNMAVKVRVS